MMSGSNSNEISPSQTPVSSSNAPKFGTLVPNRIFVGGIHTDTTETELYELFSVYGNVVATKIIADRAGVSKGYGFVTFETEEEARRIQNEDNIILKDRKLNVAPAIKKQQPFSRNFGTDMSSPDTCSSVEPSDTSLSRGVVGNASEWNAIANPNPAEPAPMANSAVYYSSGVPYAAYPGVYNYLPSEHNPCQFQQQPYVLYSPIYIPPQYHTPTTPQLHWGGATFRWPNQVGYEQSNPSPQTSAASTTTSPSIQYAYSLSSGPSTPTSTVSSGQKNTPGTSTTLSQNVGEKTGTYYPSMPTAGTLNAPVYTTYPLPFQYTLPPQQRMGDGCEAAVGETAPTESPPYNQGMYQKGPRTHQANYSPRKGTPSFFANHNYNTRHYSPQRNYKPRYHDMNASSSNSQHYSDGKISSGRHHAVPLTPPATPMTIKSAANGSDHIADASHRFKSLKLRD